MQIADGSILPNVIEFNVTVAAAATPAYDVILSAGSTAFTITSTDSIVGPSSVTNDSNFAVTDNSIMKWKQALLSEFSIFDNHDLNWKK